MTEPQKKNTKTSKTKLTTVISQQYSVVLNKIKSLDVGLKQYPEWCVMLKPAKPNEDDFEASVLYAEQLELYKQANAVKEEIDRFNNIIISQNHELAMLSSQLYELSPIDYPALFDIFKSMNLTIPKKLFALVNRIEKERQKGLTKTEIKQATLFRYKSDYRVDNVYAFVSKMKDQAKWYINAYREDVNKEWIKQFGNDI